MWTCVGLTRQPIQPDKNRFHLTDFADQRYFWSSQPETNQIGYGFTLQNPNGFWSRREVVHIYLWLLPNPSSKQCSLELLRIYESARLETSLGEENDDGARVQMNNSLPALTSDTSPSVVNLFRINKVADRLSWIAQPGNRGEPYEFYNLCLSLSRSVFSNLIFFVTHSK